MGNTGRKPKRLVKTKWSDDFAYGIGLLVSDGNLSPDGRHIVFVSKEDDQIKNFLKAFKIRGIKVGTTTSGKGSKKSNRIQFGDVVFYKFLLGIGLMPAKSKVIGEVDIPKKYFFSFLRGLFDGDGTFYSYWDLRWRSSFMFYTEFVSASKENISWIRNELFKRLKIKGHITNNKKRSVIQLKYAKKESIFLLRKMYENKKGIYLKRKKLKMRRALAIVGEHF